MKTAKTGKTGKAAAVASVIVALALAPAACNNFFHDLIPPDGDRIVSFRIDGQLGPAAIGDETITVQVSLNAEIDSLIPQIAVSEGATLFPITGEYLREMFPGAEIDGSAIYSILADANPGGRLLALIGENPGFRVPDLGIPMDFRRQPPIPPVRLLVLAGRGNHRVYTVVVEKRDPAGISEFRFDVGDNPSIAATAEARIEDDAETNSGTITAKVMYDGDLPPRSLIPRFVTPGTARVNGAVQHSGESAQDFSFPVEYGVTPPDGDVARVYTVKTEFAQAPKMLEFRFSAADNPGGALKEDAVGEIDGAARKISVRVGYGGDEEPPATLAPSFRARGTVTVDGKPQVSGSSAHDFARPVVYAVTGESDSDPRVEYGIDFRFAPEARISSFVFARGKNPGLEKDASAKPRPDGSWLVQVPEGFGIESRDLIPDFDAIGIATVGGNRQIPGVSSLSFADPVTYAAKSANGLYSAEYTVVVREVPMPRIFVDARATGGNTGESWRDAFASLSDAAEKAAKFDPDVPKEIWIAAGNYGPGAGGAIPVAANTSFMGGFSGGEATPTDRANPGANMATVSGTLSGKGGGTGAWDAEIEWLEMAGNRGRAIDLSGMTGRTSISNVKNDGGIYVSGGSSATFRNVVIDGSAEGGISARDVNGPVAIEDAEIRDVAGDAIYAVGRMPSLRVSRVEIDGVRDGRAIYAHDMETGSGEFAIERVTVANVANKSFPNNHTESAIMAGAGRIAISDVAVSGVRTGNGNFMHAFYVNFRTGLTVSDVGMNDVDGSGMEIHGTGGTAGFSRVDADSLAGVGINIGNSGPISFLDCRVANSGGSAIRAEGTTVAVRNAQARETGGKYIVNSDGDDWWNAYELRDGGLNLKGGTVSVDGYVGVDNWRYNVQIGSPAKDVSVSNVSVVNDDPNQLGSAVSVGRTTGKLEISKVRVGGRQHTWFNAISVQSDAGRISIYDVDIDIAGGGRAFEYPGGGISVYAKAAVETEIRNSTVKNTGVALKIDGGNFRVTDVGFVNNMGQNGAGYNHGNLVEINSARGTFERCRFEHEDGWQPLVPPWDNGGLYRHWTLFALYSGFVEFDDCDFANLKGHPNGWDTYIFSRWGTRSNYYAYPLEPDHRPQNVEIRNSRFTFRRGENVGLFAGFAAGWHYYKPPGAWVHPPVEGPDSLLMENASIDDGGSARPLFWLYGASPPDAFKFGGEIRYRAPGAAEFETLTTAKDFYDRGLVQRDQGGSVTIVK